MLGLFLDIFSQHLWVTKFKTAGTAKTTVDSLTGIFNHFTAAETFMTDGGRHFNNDLVKTFCAKWSCTHHIVAAYSPWINGLVEGTNKLLLHILKQLCVPNLGEDNAMEDNWETLPKTWPDHLDDAVRALNNRLLPSLKFTPKELLLGLVVDTKHTELTCSMTEPSAIDAAIHMAYIAQQCLDGYDEAVRHAIKRKATFDCHILKRQPVEVIFTPGQLIQVYRSNLNYTFKTERKILPKWSCPHRVTLQLRNLYRVETLAGMPLTGEFSARWLQAFIPREGTQLHKDQQEYMCKLLSQPEGDGREEQWQRGNYNREDDKEEDEEVPWDDEEPPDNIERTEAKRIAEGPTGEERVTAGPDSRSDGEGG